MLSVRQAVAKAFPARVSYLDEGQGRHQDDRSCWVASRGPPGKPLSVQAPHKTWSVTISSTWETTYRKVPGLRETPAGLTRSDNEENQFTRAGITRMRTPIGRSVPDLPGCVTTGKTLVRRFVAFKPPSSFTLRAQGGRSAPPPRPHHHSVRPKRTSRRLISMHTVELPLKLSQCRCLTSRCSRRPLFRSTMALEAAVVAECG